METSYVEGLNFRYTVVCPGRKQDGLELRSRRNLKYLPGFFQFYLLHKLNFRFTTISNR